MAVKNQYLDVNDTNNDFGFTFSDEDEIVASHTQYSSLQEEVDDLRKRSY